MRPLPQRGAVALRTNCSVYLNGFAVANHSPMPVAMMNAPSSTPTSRKTLFCSVSISSGWRAEADHVADAEREEVDAVHGGSRRLRDAR